MDPLTTALAVQAGSNIASSAINLHTANKQMKFQEMMSNTAHQREVRDLIAAGLNPILSAKYGGASTPPGAGMNVNAMGDIASSAVKIKEYGLHKAQAASQIDLQSSQALAAQKQASVNSAMEGKIMEESAIANYAWQRQEWEKRNLWPLHKKIMEANAQNALNSTKEIEATAKMWDTLGAHGKGAQFILPFLMMLMRGRSGGTKYMPVPSYEWKGY